MWTVALYLMARANWHQSRIRIRRLVWTCAQLSVQKS